MQVYTIQELFAYLATHSSRKAFLSGFKWLARFKVKVIIVESNITTLKTPYDFNTVPPNAVTGNLIALIARWRIPIIFADTSVLAEEITASLLRKFSVFEVLEKEGNPRQFIVEDIQALAFFFKPQSNSYHFHKKILSHK